MVCSRNTPSTKVIEVIVRQPHSGEGTQMHPVSSLFNNQLNDKTPNGVVGGAFVAPLI